MERWFTQVAQHATLFRADLKNFGCMSTFLSLSWWEFIHSTDFSMWFWDWNCVISHQVGMNYWCLPESICVYMQPWTSCCIWHRRNFWFINLSGIVMLIGQGKAQVFLGYFVLAGNVPAFSFVKTWWCIISHSPQDEENRHQEHMELVWIFAAWLTV